MQDISESFKVDYYDFGCTIYYYTKFGGNRISSLAAHWKQRDTQIEVYIDRENIHVWCRIRLTYLSFWELTRTLQSASSSSLSLCRPGGVGGGVGGGGVWYMQKLKCPR